MSRTVVRISVTCQSNPCPPLFRPSRLLLFVVGALSPMRGCSTCAVWTAFLCPGF